MTKLFATGLPLPPLETLSAQNASQMRELARIGNGHPRAIDYSPDGQYLAIASTIGIWLFDSTFQKQPRLIASDSSNDYIAFSADSKQIATSTKDHSVMVWDVESGNSVVSFRHTAEPPYPTSIAFHPTGSLLASAHWNAIDLWNLETGELLQTIPMKEISAYITFSADGKILGVGGHYYAYQYNLGRQTLEQLPPIVPKMRATRIAFSKQGATAYASSGAIFFWEGQTAADPQRFELGTMHSITTLQFSSSGTWLVISHWNGDVRMVNVKTGEQQIVENDKGIDAAFSPDEKTLAYVTGRQNGSVYFYDLESQQKSYLNFFGTVSGGLAISPDNKTLAYGQSQEVIRFINVYEPTDDREVDKKTVHLESAVNIFAFSPDGKTLALCAGRIHKDIYLWNLETNDVEELKMTEKSHDHSSRIRFSPDGQKLIVTASGGYLWNIAAKTAKTWFSKIGESSFQDMDIASAVPTIAIAGYFKSEEWSGIKLLNSDTGDLLTSLPQPKTETEAWTLHKIALNRDASLIAVAGRAWDKTKSTDISSSIGWLWDVKTKEVLFSFKTDTYYGARMECVGFSPNEDLVVFGDLNGDLHLWDVNKKTRIGIYPQHLSSLPIIQFSSDGAFLATLSTDGSLRLWGVSKSI